MKFFFFENFFFEIFFSNFRSPIKDFKWGRKCIFMNCASLNGSPQQIPLRQLPFSNEAKPHSHCRGLWAQSNVEFVKFFGITKVYYWQVVHYFEVPLYPMNEFLSTARPVDFRQIWKNFQKDLHVMKEHASGAQNIFCLKS